MRLRLLIDVLWNEDKIPGLQGLVADQAELYLLIPGFAMEGEYRGRLMGAQPVEVEEE